MPNWMPALKTTEDEIAEEQFRLEEARQKAAARVPAWMPQFPTSQPSSQIGVFAPERPTIETVEIPAPAPTVSWPVEEERQIPAWAAGVIPPAKVITPEIPKEAIEPKANISWWEQPKALSEKGAELIGKGLSYVPILPKALTAIAPAFDWIHENLEAPFAATVTSLFSPALPWQKGESWLEHEKREYNTWQAPTYVKGLAEFAMPLWWLPWFSWAKAGGKALGIGGKAVRVASTVEGATKLVLPTDKFLGETLFKPDALRRFSQWAENRPVIGNVVKAVGGESAFVKAPGIGESALDITRRALIKRSYIEDLGKNGGKGLLLPRLQQYGDYMGLLQIDDAGRVGAAVPKPHLKISTGISDVVESPWRYDFANPKAREFIDETRKVLKEVYDLAAKEGVEVPKDIIYHRLVEGKAFSQEAIERMAKEQKKTVDKVMSELGELYEKSEFGSLFEKARHYKTMEAGIKAGVKYGTDPVKSVSATIDHYMRRIASKRFDDEIGKLGKTVIQKVSEIEPGLVENLTATASRLGSAKFAQQALARLTGYGGTHIPAATIAKIRRGLPEIATLIDSALSIPVTSLDDALKGLSKDFWQTTKIRPTEFKLMLTPEAGRVKLSEIERAIKTLNVSNERAVESLESMARYTYKLEKLKVDAALKAAKEEAGNLVKTARAEMGPLRQEYRIIARRYTEGRQILGENEAKFRFHPAFGNKIFPAEVVKTVEKALGDKGSQWLKSAAGITGTGRMLIASMDFSSPFIQGLVVLGRNPVAWGKAVLKQFEFFANPQNLYKYLASPEAMTVAAERIKYGGSRATFEYFEALKPLQQAAGKIPAIGKAGQKAISATYGRAEAAFTGFGEVARNEMWKALRKPAMGEAELGELARTIDRMTGVMSMEALGIGRTQKDFENAFVFFAPRYTRAGLSYAADIFKGGLTGNMARQGLGSLLAGGMAMYIGACKAAGQQPNLNPESSRFLTIKVGDSYVGVGGIFYALARMQAGVLATATGDNPANLIAMDRFDNPFIKFMFNRTSPLTGGLLNIIEQKDYFGEPFESPADWGNFVMQRVTPIAAQQVIEDVVKGRGVSPAVFASNMAGARTFPKSAWELQEEARDRKSQELYGVSYAGLDELGQKQVDKLPEVTLFQPEIDKQTVNRGDATSMAFLNWKREREAARSSYVDTLKGYQKAVDNGVISGYEFRDLMSNAGYGYSATLQHINANPEYKKVFEELDKPRNLSNKALQDVVYDRLMEASFSGQFEDEYGMRKWNEYDAFVNRLKASVSPDVWARVVQRQQASYADLPPLAQEYKRAQEALKPYWAVQDEVTRMFGKVYAASSRGQALIQKQRKWMRLSSPQIAKYYNLFYAREA